MQTKRMLRRSLLAGLTVFGLGFIARPAHAIRPFVTDDARVVGEKLAQLETWAVLNRRLAEHNVLFAIGPTDYLELTLGFSHGSHLKGPAQGYSLTGPLAQAKALLLSAKDHGRPGIALSSGIFPAVGTGSFVRGGHTGFLFLALTESLRQERVFIHANLGVTFEGTNQARVTSGLGVQAHLLGAFYGVAEIYYGDPYDSHANFPAMQAGFRYVLSDRVQFDSTFGTTLTQVTRTFGHTQTEQWGTIGLRLVTPELW